MSAALYNIWESQTRCLCPACLAGEVCHLFECQPCLEECQQHTVLEVLLDEFKFCILAFRVHHSAWYCVQLTNVYKQVQANQCNNACLWYAKVRVAADWWILLQQQTSGSIVYTTNWQRWYQSCCVIGQQPVQCTTEHTVPTIMKLHLKAIASPSIKQNLLLRCCLRHLYTSYKGYVWDWSVLPVVSLLHILHVPTSYTRPIQNVNTNEIVLKRLSEPI